MESKEFNEIKNIRGLLKHWWNYYGKMIYTLGELEQFYQLLEQDCEKVLDVAVASYIHGMSSQVLLISIRNNCVDKLYKSLPNISQMPEDKRNLYAEIKQEFLTEISSTYDNSSSKTR